MSDHDAAALTAFAELVEQLRTDVGDMVGRLMNLTGPSNEMLMVEQAVHARATMWASALVGDDDKVAADTVLDLVNLLWPHAEPTAEWWRTPLGRAVARSVGHPTAEVVSSTIAAAMLQCTKQNITKLVAAGRLHRGPAGGVTTASIRTELRAVEEGERRTWRRTPANYDVVLLDTDSTTSATAKRQLDPSGREEL